MKKEIETRLHKIIEESEGLSFMKDDINMDANITSLGINSLIFVKLIVAIENEFEIEFEDDDLDIEKLNTLRDFVDYIESQLMKTN